MLSLITKRSGDDMQTPMPFHIPLTSAYLCQDCNCVSNCSRRCPACASEVLMGLASVLNREEVAAEAMTHDAYTYRPSLVA